MLAPSAASRTAASVRHNALRAPLRMLSQNPNQSTTKPTSLSPLMQVGGVHGSRQGTKMWRNKPLFRREGDVRFKTGLEASTMLSQEALRRDKHLTEFLQTYGQVMSSLSVVFDRMPKHAWIAKQLLEPERTVHFRVGWLDDEGNSRVNRGWRVQYSSALGPYEGPLIFNTSVTDAMMKAIGFDTLFQNSLTGLPMGAACGGADFEPDNKSEAEIQRFCQSFMTELSKYIGPDVDFPGMGMGCGVQEIGYLYGQYKRINVHIGQKGTGLLWGGIPQYPQATGWGIVHFAKQMLQDKKTTLQGKRCLVLGSDRVALAVGEKLIQMGAIPLTFSDAGGHVYEPDGFDATKLKTIMKIKAERGGRVGRYIIASTTAKFMEPENVFSIPCDIVFACSGMNTISGANAQLLADNGCTMVVEGCHMPSTPDAISTYKKRGVSLGPYKATMAGGAVCNGLQLDAHQLHPEESIDARISSCVSNIYDEVVATAKEFNTRGDLNAGANIAGFLNVADVMLAHGAV